ncbi:putative camp-independent regulatory protein [Podospora australis]|uniref:Camp-independent regulatory protein n=1 Tax=Podospora australis TaxID=1536484 RepID=A0AAN6X505_9PEZI|nr:putative camp-independent regulatory protein [Podospora australis]
MTMMNPMETYYGVVKTPADAIKLFEACRLGMLPRVQRRLSEKERQQIRSGSVFVWDEREAGMRRWTDGKSWSASRVSGSFLTYREMEGKRGNTFGASRRGAGKTPDSGRGSDDDVQDDDGPDGMGYRYKADGLMKQSFSITTSQAQHLHLISYYTRSQQNLPQPTTDPQLRHVVPQKGMYPESSLNEPSAPALTRSPLQQSPYASHPHLVIHHQVYPSPHHYQQSGYWPPSPGTTPPYVQPPYNGPPHNGHPHAGHPSPYPQHHHLPPLPPPPPQQQHHYPPAPQHPYHAPHPGHQAYERAPPPLPPLQSPAPPQQSLPHPQQYAQHPQHPQHPHLSPAPRIAPIGSPRSHQLQAQAREAIGGSQHPGPQLPPVHHQPQPGPQLAPVQQPLHPLSTRSPTLRALSVSPSAASDGRDREPVSASTKPSLSALLSGPVPTPPGSSTEPNSAGVSAGGSNSANSSPRTAHGNQQFPLRELQPVKVPRDEQMAANSESKRALGALDRNMKF